MKKNEKGFTPSRRDARGKGAENAEVKKRVTKAFERE